MVGAGVRGAAGVGGIGAVWVKMPGVGRIMSFRVRGYLRAGKTSSSCVCTVACRLLRISQTIIRSKARVPP